MARDNNREKIDRLKPEDRILWDQVRRTAIPLAKSAILSVEMKDMPAFFSMELIRQARLKNVKDDDSDRQATLPKLFAFDKPTYRKISRGRVEIEGRVDLHGLYRDEAYSLLLNFLQSARHRGLRHVLVITGKGLSHGSEGVLRQAVPHWLETAPFRQIVSSFDDAPRNHGGKGALYVRLRRQAKI